MASDKIKVAVRVRPFNRRELELGTACVLEMEDTRTVLQPPSSSGDKGAGRKQPKSFSYDYCFNSLDPKDANFSSQDVVFDCLGQDILENAFKAGVNILCKYCQTFGSKTKWLSEENSRNIQNSIFYSFQGYNACIFAYGQTGSGKSYTMMGSQVSTVQVYRSRYTECHPTLYSCTVKEYSTGI